MKEKLINTFVWFKQTSTLVGMPVLFILVTMGVQKFFFTTTCYTVGWRCEYSFGATDAMASYMGELLASNPGMDIVTKPRRRDG